MSASKEEKRFERRLRPYHQDHGQARAQLADVGFILRGSIALRRLTCGQPACRCQDSGKGHGPYYQITWKEGGKTMSRFLPASLVPLYREWLSNAHALDRIIDRMLTVSRKAADAVRAEEANTDKPAKAPKRRRSPR